MKISLTKMPDDQVHDVLSASATQLPTEPPDQGLPRRNGRSVMRRFVNLCLEISSKFPKVNVNKLG
jgi:hypothetical protein